MISTYAYLKKYTNTQISINAIDLNRIGLALVNLNIKSKIRKIRKKTIVNGKALTNM
jgi:hypothetical protein